MAGYRKLGKTASQRKALLRNQVTNLLYHGKIVTTETRAKEIRKIAEGYIAMAVRERDNFETVTVTITNNEPGATVVYEVYCEGELIDSGEFTGDEYAFTVTGPGSYVVHAVATMQGMLDSPDGGVFFVILPNDTPPVGIDEIANGKTVAGVRYFNALGQEMQDVNGMTIVVTTYTDGTTSTAKVIK